MNLSNVDLKSTGTTLMISTAGRGQHSVHTHVGLQPCLHHWSVYLTSNFMENFYFVNKNCDYVKRSLPYESVLTAMDDLMSVVSHYAM